MRSLYFLRSRMLINELLSSSLMFADEYWRLNLLISLFGFDPPKSAPLSPLPPCNYANGFARKSNAISARPRGCSSPSALPAAPLESSPAARPPKIDEAMARIEGRAPAFAGCFSTSSKTSRLVNGQRSNSFIWIQRLTAVVGEEGGNNCDRDYD